MKREDYITWDEYFMGIAILSSERSKDPSTAVGACIVNSDNKIINDVKRYTSNQYSSDVFPWDREGSFMETKYAYVCHAEMNAILNCPTSLKDSRCYVTLFPCNECAKAIVQSGIKEIIYLNDKYHDTDGCKVARKIFDECGVTYRQYEVQGRDITISL